MNKLSEIYTNNDRSLMIIDDDDVFRNRLITAMKRKGYEAFGASSVSEAITLVNANAPKYAVIDLRLNDGNGLEVVSILSNKRPDSKIVMLTGYGNIPTAVAAVKEGACDYLAKPADADDIEAALKLLIHLHLNLHKIPCLRIGLSGSIYSEFMSFVIEMYPRLLED